ncbi:sigma-70 family RNA polymerase sigma factor [Streptomyces flaveolus]|uniref:sigma-70 family RNA polymerase sigma factor n=1 Tax=Streptomyces flaveolus TaxID=67297 RepID=UPI0033FA9E8B
MIGSYTEDRTEPAYATRLTGDRLAAEDVVQETLIRAWRHPEVVANPQGSLRGGLMTVARNIVTDRFRARAARPAEVAETESTVAVERDHADAVVDSVVLMDALDRLKPERREVLVEIYYRGRTASGAAGLLGIPEGTVKSRTHHAPKALRKLYSSTSGSGADLREVAA